MKDETLDARLEELMGYFTYLYNAVIDTVLLFISNLCSFKSVSRELFILSHLKCSLIKFRPQNVFVLNKCKIQQFKELTNCYILYCIKVL